MQVEFLSSFDKDLDRIHAKPVKKAVAKVITKVEAVKRISELSGVKKLSGHKSAFRIRIGDYRIGFFTEGNVVQFAHVLHRKDIYKVFP